MENLLRHEYTKHYSLPKCETPNIVVSTTELYFEVEDSKENETIIHTVINDGQAKFNNPSQLTVEIANYDKFLTSLAHDFRRGKKRCDLIVVPMEGNCFILGELKDSQNIKNSRKDAKKQLIGSLKVLSEVVNIQELMNRKNTRKCCYFNKQPKAPEIINATTAFNPLPMIAPDGLKMDSKEIEDLNFEFWEYTGKQTLTLT